MDIKLGEVTSLFISYNIAISWLRPLNGSRYNFLLRDSENNLFRPVDSNYTSLSADVRMY